MPEENVQNNQTPPADDKGKEGGKTPDAGKTPDDAKDAELKAAQSKSADLEKQLKAYQDKEAAEADKHKTLEQKLAERDAAYKALELNNRRVQIAISKGLPLDMADRLRGESNAELEADADKLLTMVKAADPKEGAGKSKQPTVNNDSNRETAKPQTGQEKFYADRNERLGKSNLKVAK